MSASVVSRPPSHMDNRVLEQTNQLSPPLSSLAPLDEPPAPSEPAFDSGQSILEEFDPLDLPTEDVMDHEPTLPQADLPLPPAADSPTLPPNAYTYQTDQMNVDSYSTGPRNDTFAAQQQPHVVTPSEPGNMDDTAASRTPPVANRPMMVPVRMSARENQPRRRRSGSHSQTVQPEATSQIPPQTEPAGDDNPHSEDESSIEDGEDDEEEEEEEEDNSDREFLEGMVEDLSVPTAEALEKIERSVESSAMDHGVWESRVYKTPGDPEYQPRMAGRIIWGLQGFHGTVDAPNKKRIMRSSPVSIGGFRFNIKIFPRGNEGTDHISVYIECTGPSNPAIPTSATEDEHKEATAPNSKVQVTTDGNSSKQKWEVPAQFGCIMYNPQDPRVYKFEQATHHFQEDNPDWGWTRFYGPWNTLHVRRWDQRRPMLQNDELAFCVYLRTFEDPTRGLWWQPTAVCSWNSFAKTGLRSIVGEGTSWRALAAALAPWLHLTPFQKLLTNASIPRSHLESQKRPWPMFEALHHVLQQKNQTDASNHGANVGIVEKLLDWYDADLMESTDVVEIWENLRSILNREYYGDRGNPSHHNDILSFIKTYKVNCDPETPSERPHLISRKQRSAQEIVETLHTDGQTMYKEWEGQKPTGKDFPAVLQIELCRQRYDSQQRAWKRLTHRIHIDETIKIKDISYRLFGLVVSRGKLGSGKTYSIVRSSNIESQWVAYRGGVVSLLTSQTALRSHEGEGSIREGDESVAQVLIYIRSSCCAKYLPAKPQFPNTPIMHCFPALEKALRKTAEPLATLPVVIHYARAFEGYQGSGIVDPYRPVLSGVSGIELPSHFNSESTIESVENYLQATRGGNLHFKCSVLEWEDAPAYRPPRPRPCSPTEKLGEVCKRFACVHLWARCVPPQLKRSKVVAENGETPKEPKSVQPKEVFVKVFDHHARKVTGIVNFTAVKDSKISNFIPPAKLPSGPLAIYVEQADGHEVKRSNITLDTLVSSKELHPNCVLVIAYNPQGENVVHSEHDYQQELHDHYLRQRYRNHFAYQGPMHRRSYFGGVHIQSQLQDGLIHGYGTLVEANGDYYMGNFRSGYMHGEGIMYYANGDTYVGSWVADERSGYGKMVYKSTGNTYIGEWREGRRYGSGTMTFKKADEQQAMCHICYGNEIDTLFYRCGHILACESCARQCKDCPVCRKSVDAVVKIYDMRREGI